MKKILLFLAFFFSFAQIVLAANIFTSDSSGTQKTIFYTNETVYLAPTATNVTTNSTTVRVYIMQAATTWNNQTNLTDASGNYKVFTTNGSGYINTTNIIWPATLKVGNYDVVIDVNSNGVYDKNVDFVFDSSAIGFQVIAVPGPALAISVGENSTANHTYIIPSNSTENVMLQIKAAAGSYENVRLNDISLIASGSGDDTTGISMVKLILDANNDGKYNSSEIVLGAGKFIRDNGFLDISVINPQTGYAVPANTTVYFLVVYTMTNKSLNGDTYYFQLASATATGASSGTSAKITGLPIYSAMKTISLASATNTTTSTTTSSAIQTTTTSLSSNKNESQPRFFWIYLAAGVSAAVIIFFVILYLRASRPYQYEFKPPT